MRRRTGCLVAAGGAVLVLGYFVATVPSALGRVSVVVLNETGRTLIVAIGDRETEVPTGTYRKVDGVRTRGATSIVARSVEGEALEAFEIAWTAETRREHRYGLCYNVLAAGRFYSVDYDAFYDRGNTGGDPPTDQPRSLRLLTAYDQRLIRGANWRFYDQPLPTTSKRAVVRLDRVPRDLPEAQVAAYLTALLQEELASRPKP